MGAPNFEEQPSQPVQSAETKPAQPEVEEEGILESGPEIVEPTQAEPSEAAMAQASGSYMGSPDIYKAEAHPDQPKAVQSEAPEEVKLTQPEPKVESSELEPGDENLPELEVNAEAAQPEITISDIRPEEMNLPKLELGERVVPKGEPIDLSEFEDANPLEAKPEAVKAEAAEVTPEEKKPEEELPVEVLLAEMRKAARRETEAAKAEAGAEEEIIEPEVAEAQPVQPEPAEAEMIKDFFEDYSAVQTGGQEQEAPKAETPSVPRPVAPRPPRPVIRPEAVRTERPETIEIKETVEEGIENFDDLLDFSEIMIGGIREEADRTAKEEDLAYEDEKKPSFLAGLKALRDQAVNKIKGVINSFSPDARKSRRVAKYWETLPAQAGSGASARGLADMERQKAEAKAKEEFEKRGGTVSGAETLTEEEAEDFVKKELERRAALAKEAAAKVEAEKAAAAKKTAEAQVAAREVKPLTAKEAAEKEEAEAWEHFIGEKAVEAPQKPVTEAKAVEAAVAQAAEKPLTPEEEAEAIELREGTLYRMYRLHRMRAGLNFSESLAKEFVKSIEDELRRRKITKPLTADIDEIYEEKMAEVEGRPKPVKKDKPVVKETEAQKPAVEQKAEQPAAKTPEVAEGKAGKEVQAEEDEDSLQLASYDEQLEEIKAINAKEEAERRSAEAWEHFIGEAEAKMPQKPDEKEKQVSKRRKPSKKPLQKSKKTTRKSPQKSARKKAKAA